MCCAWNGGLFWVRYYIY